MEAMILAAGEGTRLRPLTDNTPRVLLPIGNKPMVECNIEWLKEQGITDIIINLNHLGSAIKDRLGDGSWLGVRISYSIEDIPLGTAGSVKKAEDFFGKTFIVIYGGHLTDFNLAEMINRHHQQKAMATLALFHTNNPSEAGIVKMDRRDRLISFVEKPLPGTEKGNLANAGVYVLEKTVLGCIPPNQFHDFGYEVIPHLIKKGAPVYGFCLKEDDFLLHINTPEQYQLARQEFRQRRTDDSHNYR